MKIKQVHFNRNKNYDNVSIKEYFIDCRTAVYFSVYRGENPYKNLLKDIEEKDKYYKEFIPRV